MGKYDVKGQSQSTVDSFRVLRLFFGGKYKIIGGFWELWELAFRMYALTILIQNQKCLKNAKNESEDNNFPLAI